MMLAAIVPEVQRRGYGLELVAVGPAVDIWRDAGHAVTTVNTVRDVSLNAVDAVITGTGFSDTEREMWKWARSSNCPTMAVIDAWTNLALRFQGHEEMVVPDVVGVLDLAMAQAFEGFSWWHGITHVIGQAHLQAQTNRLRDKRKARAGGASQVVFFSEPVKEDFGDSRGFDQFGVFSTLIECIGKRSDIQLLVKPHPRENAVMWQDIVDGSAQLSELSAADLLVMADGVIGMTTMVLVEAHLLGIPVLSLQPNRSEIVNPMIEDISQPVLNWQNFYDVWRVFQAAIGLKQPVASRLESLIANADERLVEAINDI